MEDPRDVRDSRDRRRGQSPAAGRGTSRDRDDRSHHHHHHHGRSPSRGRSRPRYDDDDGWGEVRARRGSPAYGRGASRGPSQSPAGRGGRDEYDDRDRRRRSSRDVSRSRVPRGGYRGDGESSGDGWGDARDGPQSYRSGARDGRWSRGDVVGRLSRLPQADLNPNNRHILPAEYAARIAPPPAARRAPSPASGSYARRRTTSAGGQPRMALPEPSLADRPEWIGTKEPSAPRPTRQRTASLLYGDAHRQWAARQVAAAGGVPSASAARAERESVDTAYASTGVPSWRGLAASNAAQLIHASAAAAPIVLDVVFAALLLLGDTRLTKTHAAAVVNDPGFVNRLARYPLNKCPQRTAERAHEHLTTTGLAPWSEELEATVIEESGGNPAGAQIYRWATATVALLSRKYGLPLADGAPADAPGYPEDSFGLPPARFDSAYSAGAGGYPPPGASGGIYAPAYGAPVGGAPRALSRGSSPAPAAAPHYGWDAHHAQGPRATSAAPTGDRGTLRGSMWRDALPHDVPPPAGGWSRGPSPAAVSRNVPPESYMRGSEGLWGAAPEPADGYHPHVHPPRTSGPDPRAYQRSLGAPGGYQRDTPVYTDAYGAPPDYTPGAGGHRVGADTLAHWVDDEW